ATKQAKGRAVDRRRDIFALGCLLYEMLTARRAFDGEDVTDILSRILQREPDWTLLPSNAGPRIRELLRLCLEKDVRKRRSGAADVRIDIEQALSEPLESATLPAMPTHLRLAWILAVVSLLAIAALAVPTVRHLREAAPPETRVEVNMPPTADPFSFAISPDGRRLVFVASMESKSQLWVRPLDSPTAQPLAGTDGA